MTFSYLSVCSGLEGASLAFESLGAVPVGFSEIEKFPAAIIAERYGSNMPGEMLSHNAPPNFGDFTKIPLETLGNVDVLIGGTPCQAFSIAGKRLSLDDARGNLTLAFAVLAHELARSHGLRNVIWENVPGALNTPDNAFGCFLGALVGHDSALPCPKGRGWPNAGMVDGPRARAAWRILDAQYFGLAQRRERVFVVADFGNGADPAQVLFEPQGLRGNSAPSRKAGEGIASTIEASLGRRCGQPNDHDPAGGLIASTGDISHCLNAGGMGRQDYETETLVAHSLRADGFDASEDGTGRGTPIVPVAYPVEVAGTLKSCESGGGWSNSVDHAAAGLMIPVAFAIQERAVSENPDAGPQGSGIQQDCAYTLEARHHVQAVAFSCKDHGADAGEISPTLRSMGFDGSHANGGGQVAVAFDLRGRENGAQFEGPHDTANIRAANGGSSRSYVVADDIHPTLCREPGGPASQDWKMHVAVAENNGHHWAVRRLTPAECEKLQGVPVGHTKIPWRGKPASECPDGPRYKALGNSWAVPVVFWIGSRLAAALAAGAVNQAETAE